VWFASIDWLLIDLWPLKPFQQCPHTWWIFVPSFVEICPLSVLSEEKSRHTEFRVRRRSRRTFSTHFEIFRQRFDRVVIIFFFDSDFKFFDNASEFSVTFYMLFFLFKVHVGFSSSQVNTKKYDSDEIISRPWCRNALLTRQEIIKYATGILMYVIAVNKS